MEQKLKIVAMALLALLFISFFLYFQTGNAKRMVEKERDSLRIDNDSLNKKLGDVMQEGKKMQDKIAALNSDLDRISKERTEVQKKLDTASKEKSDLAEQIKVLQAKKPEAAPAPAPAVEQQPLSQPADSYWAGILKSKAELELQIQNVRRELKNVQITSDQLQKEKSALALEVKNLTREKSDLKRQLDYNQKMMDSIGVELVREKNDKFQIQENLKPVKEENRYLRAQLQALINRKAALEKKLLEWEDKGNTLNNRLSEMESMLKERSLQIDTLKREIESGGKAGPGTRKEPVELPEIVVRPQAPEEIPVPAVMPESNALTGKVLAVNHDNNFVIIDLGDDAGVNVGNTFTIYRDGSGIASVSVIQTRKNISACDIKREGSPIKVGDIVR